MALRGQKLSVNFLRAAKLFVLTTFLLPAPAAHAGWAEDALAREAGYICDCSYTENAGNHAGIARTADAYGAINDIRIAGGGPNWVQTTEAAVGSIGLMQAARRLRDSGQDTARCDAVLDGFFQKWILAKGQCRYPAMAGDDAGAFADRTYYTPGGRWERNESANSGATGAAICAMWKYAEYLRSAGRKPQAAAWLRAAYPAARNGADFIRRRFDPKYNLVHSSVALHNLWISDSVYSAAALRCLAAWSAQVGKPGSDYASLAHRIALGIGAMRDTSGNYYKYRDNKQGYRATYGDSIDQLCFFPYQAGLVKPDREARRISDWWTNGEGAVKMTPETSRTADWRYFGTRWHYYFDGRASNSYLYPGPGLQLAIVEWKAGKALADRTLIERAGNRFEWANRKDRSALWLGVTGESEAGIPNGIVDWRDGADYSHTAPHGDRFVDTSAYFIEATLMICWNEDTSYAPS